MCSAVMIVYQSFRKKSRNTITWFTKNGNVRIVIDLSKSHMVKRVFMTRRAGCCLADVRNAEREEEDSLEVQNKGRGLSL